MAKYDYSITGFGGDGPTLISEVILTRPANNLATNVRAYNATSGELLYQAAAASASKSEDLFVPLDWAMNDAGATSIEYLTEKTGWETI